MQGDAGAPQSDEWIKIQKNTFTNWVNVHVCALCVSFVMQASLTLAAFRLPPRSQTSQLAKIDVKVTQVEVDFVDVTEIIQLVCGR